MENTNIYWEAVSVALDIVLFYGTGYILFRFARPFMENKKGAFIIVTAYFSTMMVIRFLLTELNEINKFVLHGLGVLSAFAVMSRIDRRNYRQKIFIVVTLYSLRWQSDYMVGLSQKPYIT